MNHEPCQDAVHLDTDESGTHKNEFIHFDVLKLILTNINKNHPKHLKMLKMVELILLKK